MTKLRIVILFDPHAPHYGGSYSLIQTVIKGFKDTRILSDYEIIIVSYRNRDPKGADFHFNPENYITRLCKKVIVSKSVRLQTLLQSHSKLARFLNRHEADLVFFLGVPAQITNIPFVLTVWDLQHRTHPWFPELSKESLWQGRDRYYRKFLPRAMCVITGTKRGKQEIRNFYGVNEDNIFIIPHVIEGRSEKRKFRNPINHNSPYLYPAQFWAHKNHYVIVQAIKILRDKYEKQVFINFIGSDKGNQKYIQSLVEQLQLSDQIKFLGFVSDQEKKKLYETSKALIYSSFSGPENLPPLEALNFGLPIIYPDFPGAREQLGTMPIYFDPTSAKSLVGAIRKFEKNSARYAFVNGSQEILGKRTGEDYALKFGEIIRKLELMIRAWDKKNFSKF